MKIYSGRLKLIGDGTIEHNKMGPSRTIRSVVEIGDHTLRNIRTDNYIESYLNVGQEMKILVAKFLWKQAIFGVHHNGKSYKVRKADVWMDIPLMLLVILGFYLLVASELGFIGHLIGIVSIIWYIRIKSRAVRQFNNF